MRCADDFRSDAVRSPPPLPSRQRLQSSVLQLETQSQHLGDLDLMRMWPVVFLSFCGILCLSLFARDLWIAPDPANLPHDTFVTVVVGMAGIVGWLARRSLYLKSAVMLAAAVASARLSAHRWADGSHAMVILYGFMFFFFMGELFNAIDAILKQRKAASLSLREAGQDSKI